MSVLGERCQLLVMGIVSSAHGYTAIEYNQRVPKQTSKQKSSPSVYLSPDYEAFVFNVRQYWFQLLSSQLCRRYTLRLGPHNVLLLPLLFFLGINANEVSECTGGGRVKHVFPVRSATETPVASVSTIRPCSG